MSSSVLLMLCLQSLLRIWSQGPVVSDATLSRRKSGVLANLSISQFYLFSESVAGAKWQDPARSYILRCSVGQALDHVQLRTNISSLCPLFGDSNLYTAHQLHPFTSYSQYRLEDQSTAPIRTIIRLSTLKWQMWATPFKEPTIRC